MAQRLNAKRIRVIDAAVAPMLDVVATSLRAGSTLGDGLGAAASSGPLAPELRVVLARSRMAPLRDVLAQWGSSHRSSAARLAAAAMVITLDPGAAQASTLDSVRRRVRERVAVGLEIRAASAAARASATVIGLTPLAFAAVVGVLDPQVIAAALRSPVGRLCIAVGLVCEGVGLWWMRRLVDGPSAFTTANDDGVAELADLLALAMGAGLTASAAVVAAAPHLRGAVGRTVRVTAARITAGRRFSDELPGWVGAEALGVHAQPLVEALVAAHHEGAPAVAAIEQFATDRRQAERQRVNERVQRLPVVLLFPLVACVLPAFVMLAVAPIAIGSLIALRGG